jgi:hypothetical protein
MPTLPLERRVENLEAETRRWRRIAGLGALGVLALVVLAGSSVQQPDVLRVRGVIVVDAAGHERIFLGAPVPDPREGRRISPSVGLTINDSAGNERFGFGLQQNGRLVMGFDAPPNTGDDRNRERITLVADENGGAHLRFLDRRTRARAFLRLADDDAVYLDFLNWAGSDIKTRRLGFGLDTLFSHTR